MDFSFRTPSKSDLLVENPKKQKYHESTQTEVECTCSAMECTLQVHCKSKVLFEGPYWPLMYVLSNVNFISQLKAIWLSTKILIKIRT